MVTASYISPLGKGVTVECKPCKNVKLVGTRPNHLDQPPSWENAQAFLK